MILSKNALCLVLASLTFGACQSRSGGSGGDDESQGVVAQGSDGKEDNAWIVFNQNDRNKVCLWVAANQSPRNAARNGDGERDTNVFINNSKPLLGSTKFPNGQYFEYDKLKNFIKNNVKGSPEAKARFNFLLDSQLNEQKKHGTADNASGTVEVMRLPGDNANSFSGFAYPVKDSQGVSVVIQDLFDKANAGNQQLQSLHLDNPEACPAPKNLAIPRGDKR
jgi:hypothetical protein